MIKKRISLAVVMTALMSISSNLRAEPEAPSQVKLIEILFEEVEPGIAPYTSRILLNEAIMRLDNGRDDSDYILFNRQTHEIHSFNHEDQTHLIINPTVSEQLDFEIDFKVTTVALKDAPKVSGEVVIQHQFYVDSQLCKKSMNVTKLLPDAKLALIEYEAALVRQNITTLDNIPVSMRKGCYMANNYLHASAYLKPGFPLLVIDDEGRQKKLMDFSEVKKNRSIIQPPADYRVYYASKPS